MDTRGPKDSSAHEQLLARRVHDKELLERASRKSPLLSSRPLIRWLQTHRRYATVLEALYMLAVVWIVHRARRRMRKPQS